MPDAAASYAIFPYWDDLYTSNAGYGIFTSISGTAPNRIFNIEWRDQYYPGSGTANFEVRLYEGQTRFDIIYGANDQRGSSATVGVQKGTGPTVTQYECNTGGLSSGLMLVFDLTPCATNTPTTTSTPTSTFTPTPTNTPGRILVGHVVWEGIPQPDARSQQPITLTLKSSTIERNFGPLTTDANGYFVVSLNGLPPGEPYVWRVKGPYGSGPTHPNDPPGFLANCGTVTLLNAPETDMENGLMRGGDANNDNVVNVQDHNYLRATFGKSQGDPGYDQRADYNRDNTVNIQDFQIENRNFASSGCPPE